MGRAGEVLVEEGAKRERRRRRRKRRDERAADLTSFSSSLFPPQAYAQFIAVNGGMLMHKPKHLSHIEAAGIPENFLTGASLLRTLVRTEHELIVASSSLFIPAFQALFLVGNLQKGESALIHAGAGTSSLSKLLVLS